MSRTNRQREERAAITYEEALAYLQGLQRFGMRPGLERTRELLRRLGDPQNARHRTIHVTGTNGKGSVCAMIEACLRAAGYRVGLYISPFLEDFRERIQVNRRPIPPEVLATLVAEVRHQVAAMLAAGFQSPTEFEVTTAVAFLYFSRQRLDWLVLEVGLGGRYDATNVIDEPLLCVITNVALDHTQILGDTLEKIAWDKAGIIKPGVPCVTGVSQAGPLRCIREAAQEQQSPLYQIMPTWQAVRHDLSGQVFNLATRKREYHDLSLPLLGSHQLANAACAVTALEAAESWGLVVIPAAAIRTGLANAAWPGRLEVLSGASDGGPVIAIDGAHNPAGAEVLAQALADYLEGRPIVLVLGVLADKDVDAIIAHLVPLASAVIVTTPESPRAMAAANLAIQVGRCGVTPEVVPDLQAALELGLARTESGAALIVAGSLALAGPARTYLRRRLQLQY